MRAAIRGRTGPAVPVAVALCALALGACDGVSRVLSPSGGSSAPSGGGAEASATLLADADGRLLSYADPLSESRIGDAVSYYPEAEEVAAREVGCRSFDQAERTHLLALVNAARVAGRSCGDMSFEPASPFVWDSRLADAARAHASDMATHGFLSHTGSDGGTTGSRVTAAGLDWRLIGENVALGGDDVDATVRDWLTSPGHCFNLMNPDYEMIGMACGAPPDGGTDRYWAQVLSAAPRGSGEPEGEGAEGVPAAGSGDE